MPTKPPPERMYWRRLVLGASIEALTEVLTVIVTCLPCSVSVSRVGLMKITALYELPRPGIWLASSVMSARIPSAFSHVRSARCATLLAFSVGQLADGAHSANDPFCVFTPAVSAVPRFPWRGPAVRL